MDILDSGEHFLKWKNGQKRIMTWNFERRNYHDNFGSYLDTLWLAPELGLIWAKIPDNF